MATFRVLAGDFGEGTGQVLVGNMYRASARGLKMPVPGESFRTEHIGLGQIESLEIATEERLKKMGGAISWGMVGGLAAGPIGALAGVLAGGNKQQITFLCKFKDGREFLGSCNPDTYTSIQAASFASPDTAAQGSVRTVTRFSPEAPLRDACREGRHYSCGAGACSCPCHQRVGQQAMKRKKLVGLVTVFLVGAVAISVVLTITSARPKSSPAPIVDRTALKFVSAVLVDDLKADLTGQESAIGTFKSDDPLKWIAIDRRVTAKDYDAAYSANEIAADNEFKDKKILVSGTIDGIEKDFMGRGFLTLRGSGYSLGVHAELEDDSTREAASFRRGQKIDLVCRGSGRMATLAVLAQCKPLNDYMNEIAPSVQSKVDDFLSCRISMPRETGTAIVMLYLIGKSLPADSSCLASTNEKCQNEIMARLKDPTQLQAIKAQTSQTLPSLMIEPK